jgi:predicted O-methyltransferase YrrM
LQKSWQQILQFLRFYLAADTKFQLHSPFVFELANAVLEDRRWYYAFRDVELLRKKMLVSKLLIDVADYGAASIGSTPVQRQVPLRKLASLAASGKCQGQLLFRLTQWLKPKRILELGTSVGIGTMYIAAAARQANFHTLEGCDSCAQIAKANLESMGLDKHITLQTGAFHSSLGASLQAQKQLDLVFFDGHHRADATLKYFKQCLPHSHAHTVFVFDDIYWSSDMTAAWRQIQQHPTVTLSVDLFELGLVFFNPDLKAKQHFKLVPSAWKPWKR